MALKVERVMDGSAHIEEALGGASRLVPLHFTLSSSHDLVGVHAVAVTLPASPRPRLCRLKGILLTGDPFSSGAKVLRLPCGRIYGPEPPCVAAREDCRLFRMGMSGWASSISTARIL